MTKKDIIGILGKNGYKKDEYELYCFKNYRNNQREYSILFKNFNDINYNNRRIELNSDDEGKLKNRLENYYNIYFEK